MKEAGLQRVPAAVAVAIVTAVAVAVAAAVIVISPGGRFLISNT
jgi:hypothetical protein